MFRFLTSSKQILAIGAVVFFGQLATANLNCDDALDPKAEVPLHTLGIEQIENVRAYRNASGELNFSFPKDEILVEPLVKAIETHPEWMLGFGFKLHGQKLLFPATEVLNRNVIAQKRPFEFQDWKAKTDEWVDFQVPKLDFLRGIADAKLWLANGHGFYFVHDRASNHIVGILGMSELVYGRFRKRVQFLLELDRLSKMYQTEESIFFDDRAITTTVYWDQATEVIGEGIARRQDWSILKGYQLLESPRLSIDFLSLTEIFIIPKAKREEFHQRVAKLKAQFAVEPFRAAGV